LFIPISENLNAGWEEPGRAIEDRDSEYILRKALEAARAGAAALNLGGARPGGGELENLLWVLEAAAPAGLPALIDSPDPEVRSAGMEKCLELAGGVAPEREGGIPWVTFNSITGEESSHGDTPALAREHGAGVVALAMDGSGVPHGAGRRIEAGAALVEDLLEQGIPPGNIFLDPLVMPVAVDPENGRDVIEAVRELRGRFPGIHITCGLSNVSHGLPERRLLNRSYLSMLVSAGLDSAIMDTSDALLMSASRAAQALTGTDPFCAEYIAAYRSNNLNA